MAHKKKIDTGEFSLQGLGFNTLASAAIFGCTNPLATNFNPMANSDDGSCCLISGCTDPAACNYDPVNPACFNDGSCESTSCAGCTDSTANNYDATATIDDGSCNYTPIIPGCTCDGGAGTGAAPANDCYGDGVAAFNYDPFATVDDGTCIACVLGCTDSTFVEYDAAATCDDGSCLTACTYGCMDDDYVEYDVAATCDDGSCTILCIDGCTDSTFVEYWFDANGDPITPPATCDDNSCSTGCAWGCMDNSFVQYDPSATCPDNTCTTPCVVGCTDDDYIGYNNLATCHDQSMCGALAVPGCTDATACNFDPLANVNSGCQTGHFGCCQQCGPPLNTGIDGCCDPSMLNYNLLATCDSGQGTNCIAILYGCQDPTALNYYAGATVDDGSCVYVAGCTDSTACNYDPLADFDDGSCNLPDGCTDIVASNYDSAATCDDGSCTYAPYVVEYASWGANTRNTNLFNSGTHFLVNTYPPNTAQSVTIECITPGSDFGLVKNLNKCVIPSQCNNFKDGWDVSTLTGGSTDWIVTITDINGLVAVYDNVPTSPSGGTYSLPSSPTPDVNGDFHGCAGSAAGCNNFNGASLGYQAPIPGACGWGPPSFPHWCIMWDGVGRVN